MWEKGIAKILGKSVVIGNRPRISPSVLRPNNSNIGSSVNNRGIGYDVRFGKSQFVQNSIDINLNFILVNIQSNLDRNKHRAVRLVENGEFNVSKGKENRIFQFSESSFVCPNIEVQNSEKSIMQRKKPLDCEQEGAPNSMVKLSTEMEGIMRGIKGEPDVELQTEVMILAVKVMVDDGSGHCVISF